MPITVGELLNDRMARAVHHREQLDAIAADMCEILAITPDSVGGRLLKQAAYGELKLQDALIGLVNGKLAELSAMQIEGCD